MAPEQMSHPYQTSATDKETDTNGNSLAVTDATNGVMTLVSILVTDWSIQFAIPPRLARLTAVVAIISLQEAARGLHQG